MIETLEKAKICLHEEVETLYQYDKQKNRTNFWACPDCRILFAPKGAAEADLNECLDAIVYHRKGSRGASPRVASSWFLNLLKRHGRVKPVEGEDLDAFVRPEVE